MTTYRINPLSFIRDGQLHYQFKGRQHRLRITQDLWRLLRRFYQLPTLAPRPLDTPGFTWSHLRTMGVVLLAADVPPFLRAEGICTWFPNNWSPTYFMLSAVKLGHTSWMEFDGHKALILFADRQDVNHPQSRLYTYTGISFSCEDECSAQLAGNKAAVNALLRVAGVEVPAQLIVFADQLLSCRGPYGARRLLDRIRRTAPIGLRYPMVIKPVNLSLGLGVHIVRDDKDLITTLRRAARTFPDRHFVLENFVRGREWRCTVLSSGAWAVYERLPLRLRGDGQCSVRALVRKENARRSQLYRDLQYMHQAPLIRLRRSEQSYLTALGFSPTAVPPKGRCLHLAWRPHQDLGGLCVDVTSRAPQAAIQAMDQIRARLGLHRAGFDVRGDLAARFAVIEVNCRPGLIHHLEPDKGQPRDIPLAMLQLAAESSAPRGSFDEFFQLASWARGIS